MKRFTDEDVRQFASTACLGAQRINGEDGALPRISIVTPSFNQGRFLERAVLSVLNQHYPNLEYIIIDGGSTDESVEIIKKYEKHINYWVSEPDRGQSDAFNKGFARATGDIFFYLASDDILLPGVLDRVAGMFTAGNLDVLYGNKLIIDPDDAIISERRCVRFMGALTRWGIFSGAGFSFYPDACFFSRRIFDKVGGFDVSLHNTMDTDLEFRFLESTNKIKFLREYIIAFRVTPASKTVSLGHSRGEAERETLFAKYCPHPLAKFLKIPLTALFLLLFIVQGDLSYILFRVFKERRKKYHQYF